MFGEGIAAAGALGRRNEGESLPASRAQRARRLDDLARGIDYLHDRLLIALPRDNDAHRDLTECCLDVEDARRAVEGRASTSAG